MEQFKPTWKDMGFETEDEYLFAQSVANRDQDVVKLQSELDTLRAENARLRDEQKQYRVALWNIVESCGKLYEDLTNGRQRQNAPGAIEVAMIQDVAQHVLKLID